MTSDFDQFGIDPDDRAAKERLELSNYLVERGVTIEAIRATADIGELSLLAWSKIFGVDERRLPLSEAARRAGLSEGQVQRILAALGFADTSAGANEVGEGDVEALKLFGDMAAVLGEDELTHLSRVIGTAMTRVAEATSASMRVNVETPMLQEQSYVDFVRSTAPFVEEGIARLVDVMDRVLRYRLLSVSGQSWGVDIEGAAVTMDRAIGFADVVGFTSRTGSLAHRDLANVIDRFEGRVSEAIASNGGSVVKFIGDEVMFTFADASAACRCARRLLGLAADATIPDVRVGLAFGNVISRYGDYYGPAVNLASRLVDIAPPGSVLVTKEIAARTSDEFAFDEQPAQVVKGIDEPLEHLRLRS